MLRAFNLRRVAVLVTCLTLACGEGDDGTQVAPEPAELAVDRGSVDFGSVTLGVSSPRVTLIVANGGGSLSGTPSVTLSGAGFTLASNTCTKPVAPRRSCVIAIAFKPLESGSVSGTLSIAADPGGSIDVALEGEGLSAGALTLEATNTDLGPVVVGATSATRATYTVRNDGDQDTGPLRVQASGPAPGDFTLDDQCSDEVLAPGASCTFNVAFAPRTRGAKTASFDVRATPGGKVSAVVNGLGLAPARLVIAPTTQGFGTVALDAESPPLALVVTNVGDDTARAVTLEVTGRSATLFTTSDDCDAELAGGASCTVTVVFAPTMLGEHEAELVVSADTHSVTSFLSGEAVETQLTIVPSATTFDPTGIGERSFERSFTLKNKSRRASGAITVALAGSDPGEFELVGNDCGQVLGPNLRCTLTARFAPTRGGAASAELVVTTLGSGRIKAAISGVGLTPPNLVITPADKGFGSVPVGRNTAAQAFVVENTGGQPSGRVSVALAGVDADQFYLSSNLCRSRVQPGRRCLIEVRFRPLRVGLAEAELSVSAAPGGALSATLAGDGVDPQQLLVMPSTFAFAPTALGDSAVMNFTIDNDSNAATGLLSVGKSGPHARDFTVTHDCRALEPHASCTATVTFAPGAAGLRSAVLNVSANPGGSATSALSGVGRTRLEVVAVDGAPVTTPIDFGDVIVGTTTPRELDVIVRNNTTTTGALTIAGNLGTPAQFAVVSNSCQADGAIAPDATCTVRVRFSPTTIGPHGGTLSFAIGTTTRDRAAQAVIGRGIHPLSISPVTTTHFGDVSRNTSSAPLRFTVTNGLGAPTSGALTTTIAGTGYRIVDDACAGVVLAAGESCELTLTVSPTNNGNISGTLGVRATPGGTPTLVVSARGIDPVGAEPTAVVLTPSSVFEGVPVGTLVGALTTTDADPSDSFRYALVPGSGSTGNAAFTINGDILRTAVALDREARDSYPIRVRVTDSGGQIFDQRLVVVIDDVDEPSVVANDVAIIGEDAEATLVDVLANDTDPDTALTIAAVTQPLRGVVAIATDARSLTYKPNANYCNTPPGSTLDTFTYTLAGSGLVGIVEVAIDCVDDPGLAQNDTAAATQGDPARAIDVLANDADPDGNLRIISVTQPPEGTVVITGEGTGLTYQPSGNPSATSDVFTYTLVGGSTATVTVTVTVLDDLPVAVADAATFVEDAAATAIDVLANDTDPDGGPKLVTAITQPTNGAVVITGAGTGLTYVPTANYCNTPPGTTLDVFTYTLNGGSAATVTITVTCVDDPAVAVDDTFIVLEDAAATIVPVLDNDTASDGGELVVTAVSTSFFGSVFLTDGVVRYRPNPDRCNTVGFDSFTYTLNGGATATVRIPVTCVDDPPEPSRDNATVTEDAPATAIDVLANDPDIDGGPKFVSLVSQPTNGTVVITGDGSGVTYQPNADYCNSPQGSDTFQYVVNNANPASVTVLVTCVDDNPVAVDDAATVTEDGGAASIDVLANDTDVDAGPKLVTAVTQPTNGTVVITGGGTAVSYAPAANYCNSPPGTTPDTFTYTVTGGDTATVSMTVTCVDDNPVAVNDAITVGEDANPTAVSVLINDTDVDGGAKQVTAVTQPASGTVVITGGGAALTYAPDLDYCNSPPGTALDTFTYTITGGSTATVAVTVLCGDDIPVPVNDGFSVSEDAQDAVLDVLANDSDGDGGSFFILSFTAPAFGDLEANGDDTALVYTPDPDYCNTPPGTTLDTFTYTLFGGLSATVTVNVTCVDDRPIAVADAATVAEDSGANTIAVLTNDTDSDAGPKSVSSVTQPTNGTVVITGGGTGLTYAPASNYCNTPPGTTLDSFTYTLTPGGSATTVTMSVTCVDDAPVAVADAATVAEDAAATTIVVVTNDTDIDAGPKSVTSVTQPSNGTVTLDAGAITYRPAANYCNTPPGTALDTFTYTLTPGSSSATVSVTVTCSDDSPVAVNDAATVAESSGATTIAVLTNDTDVDAGPKSITSITQPANGTVVITGGGTGLSYQPNAGYCNTPPGTTLDTFTYTLTPGGSAATVTMTVTCVDDAPVAVADAATVTEDAAATSINVLANDTDVDGGSFLVQSVTQPANGTVVITGGGAALTYAPAANYCNSPPGTALDTFTYTLTPGGSTATVSVTVTCVDDTPVAVNDSATVSEDAGTTIIDVLANDTDVDAGPKLVSAITQPANGVVAITGGGTGLSYRPNANYCNNPPGSTLDTFTYTVTGGSSTTVIMTVTCVDDTPVAVNDAATVGEDSGANAISVLANDTDVDAGPKTVTSVEQPANGTVVITGGGTALTYTPNANYCNNPPGTTLDTFTYTLNGGSAATVTMTVTCLDDNPVAVNDTATVAENAAATTIDVLANDTDGDGGTKSITSGSALNGTVVITGGGTGLTYQPATNYCNTPPGTTLDTLTYTLNGGSTATVAITVTCVDTPPVAVNDTATVLEDVSGGAVIDVLGNDTDIDGGPKFVEDIVGFPNRNGSIALGNGGTLLTYYPPRDFCSTTAALTETFRYRLNGGSQATVTVTVTCVDDPPVAVDDAATVLEDSTAATFNVLANDTDPDIGPKAISAVTQSAQGGAVVITGGGTGLTYQPAANYCGPDTFTYTLTPGGDIATVGVTVTCVNDAPSFTKGPDISVLNQDDVGAAIAYTITPWATALSKGPANEDTQTLSFVVTNNTNSSLFTVQPTLTAAGAVQFTTNAANTGSATITVRIQDNGDTTAGGVNTSATQTFVITTNLPAPLATDDAYTATGNVYITVPAAEGVLLRGTDDTLRGAGLDFYGATASPDVAVDGTSMVTTSNGGTVLLAANGSFSYNPPAGFLGADSFYYRITNGGGSDVGQVTITVSNMVWFFDANAANAGDGRLSTPFKAVASFVNDGSSGRGNNGHSLYFFAGTYTTGLTLLRDQRVLGEGATATFAIISGLTLAPFSPTITTGGTRPVLSTTVGDIIRPGVNNYIRGLDLGSSGGTAIFGANFGTLTIRDVGIDAATGDALYLSVGTLSGAFDSITATAGTDALYLSRIATDGTFDLGAGTLRSTASVAFVDGTGTFTYRGEVNATISVNGNTGGSLTLSGPISASGSAKPLQFLGNANMSLTLSGSTKRFGAVGTGTAILAENNVASTLTFSGGGLDALTTSGTTFDIAGAGTTLVVSGSGNVLRNTRNTTLRLTGVAIGDGNVTFQRVTSGTPLQYGSTGIVIDGTAGTGSINITGDGTASSGGTIQYKSGVDGATDTGIGVYLNNTRNVNLAHMEIIITENFGLRAVAVDGLSITNCAVNSHGTSAAFDEGAIAIHASAGTVRIANTQVSGGYEDNVRIVAAPTTSMTVELDTVTIDANSTAAGNDGVRVEHVGTGALTFNVIDSTFTGARADLLQFVHSGTGSANVTVRGNAFSNNHPSIATGGGGLTFNVAGTAGATQLTFNSNTLRDALGHALLVTKGTGTSVLTGTIDGNTCGVPATANSGSREGSCVRVQSTGQGTVSLAITNNLLYQYNNFGIEVLAGGGASAQSGTVNAHITGNTISNPGTFSTMTGFPKYGIHMNIGTTLGDTFSACALIGGTGTARNSLSTAGKDGSPATLGDLDFRIRQRQSTTFRLPGYAGGPTDTTALHSYIVNRNDLGGTPVGLVEATTTGFAGAAGTCF